MSLIDKVTALWPFGKTQVEVQYYFALNIGSTKVTASTWSVEGNNLEVQNPKSADYSDSEELIDIADQLLDQSLGSLEIEPEKILFGVPDSWLLDDDLKEPYLKLLKNLVTTLELKPMAYVATSHAMAHFLEKTTGVPATAILANVEDKAVAVTIVRAGKVDGTKVVKREGNIGEEIEKILLSFSEVEVLPSRVLLFSPSETIDLEKQKSNMLSFPWMSKLSFLHFPKIDLLEKDVVIKAVSLAGAVEIEPNIKIVPQVFEDVEKPVIAQEGLGGAINDKLNDESKPQDESQEESSESLKKDEVSDKENLGFVSGDVTKQVKADVGEGDAQSEEVGNELGDESDAFGVTAVAVSPKLPQGIGEAEVVPAKVGKFPRILSKWKWLTPVLILFLLILGFILFSRAQVKVFIEPKVLERDTQVTVDPALKSIDETNKKIPGQIVETDVSGSDKLAATGKKNIGDPAKGTVTVYNKTYEPKTITKGTSISASGMKFSLNSSVTVASQSATAEGITFGKANVDVTAEVIGADGNLPDGTEFQIANNSSSQLSAKSDGNLQGGTSKEVTVVTDADQKKLLASLASSLRKQAQEKIQAKLQDKKILEEGLSEEITKKSYSKNINDQAQEFSLNLTIKYKGIAYSDADLKSILSKLVGTSVPEGFELNLAETETQADVSKVEKDKLIFLARFKAKLMPKLDISAMKKQLRGKTPAEAAEVLKSIENVLGSEIKLTPSLPEKFARLPLLDRNISIEIGLK